MENFIRENLLNAVGKINSRKLNEKWFNKNGFGQQWKELNEINNDLSLSNKIHYILSGYQKNFCIECRKEIDYKHQFCGIECSNKSSVRATKISSSWNKSVVEQRKQTMINRFGVESTFHRDCVQDKVKLAVKEKYAISINEIEMAGSSIRISL